MTHYEELNKRYKEQDLRKAFAHFPYSPASGENWETHYEKLAKMANHEDWNFKRPEFKIKYEGQNYPILADYLNYTFLRVQELDLIVYSEDGDKVHKPEALTTSGRSEVQKYKLHDNRYTTGGR